jgi:hypothetical protein
LERQLTSFEEMTRAVLNRLSASKSLTQKSLELLLSTEKDPKKTKLLKIAQISMAEIILDSQTYADFLDLKSGAFKLRYETFEL